jgi:hypothetical protein
MGFAEKLTGLLIEQTLLWRILGKNIGQIKTNADSMRRGGRT